MNRIIFIFFILGIYCHISFAENGALNLISEMPKEISILNLESLEVQQAIQLYNSKQYDSSLAILQKIKNDSNILDAFNYLSGLNYYKLQNYDIAERYLSEVTKIFNAKELANTYYHIGLCQYHKENYEQAVNSFELSLDTSNDPSLDKKSEIMIEKILQIQNQIEKDKIKWTLGFGIGFQSDSNVLNVKETDKSLRGQVLNWSAFATYKLYSDKDSLFEPMLYYSDLITFDQSFKDDNDLKKSDATQIILSTPFKIKYNLFTSKSSLNFGYYLLPNENNQKNLAISLIFFRQDVYAPIHKDLESVIKFIIGRDQSQLTYSDATDNQNSIKFELGGGLIYQIPQKLNHSVSSNIGYIINNAEGDNAKYNKYYFDLDYSMPTFIDAQSTFKIEHSVAQYFKSTSGRKEEVTNFGYNLSKDLNQRLSLSFFINQTYCYSTVESNKYDETVFGIQLLSVVKF